MSVEMIPTSTIIANLGLDENGPAIAFFRDECDRYMDDFIPLSNNQTFHMRENKTKGHNSITYKAPYSHYQYVGSQTGKKWNYTTPGTGPYWDKKMWSAHKKDVIKAVQSKFGGN